MQYPKGANMLTITRRDFIGTSVRASMTLATTGLLASAKGAGVKFKVGVTDWNLRQEGKLESIALAKKLGFDGVQVSIGRVPVADRLPLSDVALQQQYVAESKRSEERRVGKECMVQCRSRWSPYH